MVFIEHSIKTVKNKNVEAKQCATKQSPTGKIKEEVRKYPETDENKSMTMQNRGSKTSSKWKACINAVLSQETGKIPNKQPEVIPKATNETHSTSKEIVKIRAVKDEIETKKTVDKVSETRQLVL